MTSVRTLQGMSGTTVADRWPGGQGDRERLREDRRRATQRDTGKILLHTFYVRYEIDDFAVSPTFSQTRLAGSPRQWSPAAYRLADGESFPSAQFRRLTTVPYPAGKTLWRT